MFVVRSTTIVLPIFASGTFGLMVRTGSRTAGDALVERRLQSRGRDVGPERSVRAASARTTPDRPPRKPTRSAVSASTSGRCSTRDRRPRSSHRRESVRSTEIPTGCSRSRCHTRVTNPTDSDASSACSTAAPTSAVWPSSAGVVRPRPARRPERSAGCVEPFRRPRSDGRRWPGRESSRPRRCRRSSHREGSGPSSRDRIDTPRYETPPRASSTIADRDRHHDGGAASAFDVSPSSHWVSRRRSGLRSVPDDSAGQHDDSEEVFRVVRPDGRFRMIGRSIGIRAMLRDRRPPSRARRWRGP